MFNDDPPPLTFQPHQIIYLTCDHSRLYTEVIDVLADRQLAWVRPLVLVTPDETLPLATSVALGVGETPPGPEIPAVPDLLWPLDQFLPALDTDFIALLAILPNPSQKTANPAHGSAVSQFTRRLWERRQASTTPDS